MGKDWLYWVLGGKGKFSGKRRKVKLDEAASSAGCMCAVFQIFDLQNHLNLPLNHQEHEGIPGSCHLQHEQAITSSKYEMLEIHAPRNSLEMEEEEQTDMEKVGSEANVAIMKQVEQEKEGFLNLPVVMHIKTRHERIVSAKPSPRISTKSRIDDISSECSSNYGCVNSPSAANTPTLVARLMGLDLLPDSNSPSFSNSKNPKNSTCNYQRKDGTVLQIRTKGAAFSDDDISIGARSEPETPRLSSARRSDVEFHHHRLSLQINKENRNEEFGVVSKSGRMRKGGRFSVTGDENRSGSSSSPGHFAKQIVRQVKESVSRRRVGLMDITNHKLEQEQPIRRRDENLLLLNQTSKRKSNNLLNAATDANVEVPSFSPRLRILETNKTTQLPKNSSTTKSPRVSEPSDTNNSCALKPKTKQQKFPSKVTEQAIVRNNKKDEQFVRSATERKKKNSNSSKKTPLLSSDILSISGPTLVPVKKAPATKLEPQKQVAASDAAVSSKRITQLSCNPDHPYTHRDKIFAALPTGGGEYEVYINRILRLAGSKWQTHSHPLDPSIFHYLELFYPNGHSAALSRRSNRKLIFQLVDELLSEKLKPHFKPWICDRNVNGHVKLAKEICENVLGFPEANCEVLEDIDALIDTDFGPDSVEEEVEMLVFEMEGEIMEKLMHETVAVMVAGGRTAEERMSREGCAST